MKTDTLQPAALIHCSRLDFPAHAQEVGAPAIVHVGRRQIVLADAIVAHLELCGIRCFRRPPAPRHSTPDPWAGPREGKPAGEDGGWAGPLFRFGRGVPGLVFARHGDREGKAGTRDGGGFGDPDGGVDRSGPDVGKFFQGKLWFKGDGGAVV